MKEGMNGLEIFVFRLEWMEFGWRFNCGWDNCMDCNFFIVERATEKWPGDLNCEVQKLQVMVCMHAIVAIVAAISDRPL